MWVSGWRGDGGRCGGELLVGVDDFEWHMMGNRCRYMESKGRGYALDVRA